MTEDSELLSPSQPETDFFPLSPGEEHKRLQEIVKGQNVQVIPIANSGYMVYRNESEIIAEAPWVLVDFDDTAANTTYDKKERCWQTLQEKFNLPEEFVSLCDQLSRVDFGKAGKIYQPELEMRFITKALSLHKDGEKPEKIEEALQNMRKELIDKKNLKDYPADKEITELYEQTRYTSTLYPDTITSLKTFKGDSPRPLNLAVLTYGDPEFQLTKTIDLFQQSEGSLGIILLTKVKKGDFFQALIQENPFKDLPIKYTYPETPREVGINFADWEIMVTLFDDDPKQVKSFNNFAQSENINGLGVVRVRRTGAKRSKLDVQIPEGSAQVKPSDSAIDTSLFIKVLELLEAKHIEQFLIREVSRRAFQAAETLLEGQASKYVNAIAQRRGINPEEVRGSLLSYAQEV